MTTEADRLAAAIRKHRDLRGDFRCWLDDEELYQALPEGYIPPPRDYAVELANCQRFIHTRHHPGTVYVSPQTRLDTLAAALNEVGQLAALAPPSAWRDAVLEVVHHALQGDDGRDDGREEKE